MFCLWYLDAREIHTLDFDVPNESPILFRFLGITIKNLNKNSLLQLKKLTVGMLFRNFEALDEEEKYEFLYSSNNKSSNSNKINKNDKIFKLNNNELLEVYV